MRLWTLHPRYLDASGLTAVWREALLAQKVLQGMTRGYRHHPQLIRFQQHPRPLACMTLYLKAILAEADLRGYRFDPTRITAQGEHAEHMEESRGQLLYEWEHLRLKLAQRTPERIHQWEREKEPIPHPLFLIIAGEVRPWERAKRE